MNNLIKDILIIITLIGGNIYELEAFSLRENETISRLAEQFVDPADCYKPYVWWHWMGTNYSKEGITKDLEAMKAAGIGGATIFNLASAVQESHKPIDNNPWPGQTYRSDAYWEAMTHAASEAKRLGLKIGLQNTPGYSTTGGPWITEERGMQKVVMSNTVVEGGRSINLVLHKPELPVYNGWGSPKIKATFYKDIAVMAVPADTLKATIRKVIDISDKMDNTGNIKWNAPQGKWIIYRIGHAPTMANPHPLPDELIGKALEADKMSREQNIHHWNMVLEPLTEHLGEYMGNSFDHILIDSYEADNQDWTPNMRAEFIKIKGYDPVPWIALNKAVGNREDIRFFLEDYNYVVNRLFMDNGWKVGKEMINKAKLKFMWEPYSGQFDTGEGTAIADIPMGEFWTGGKGGISTKVVNAARESGKAIVAAEAFTGRPEISQYTEDPEFLKRSADGSFASGANQLFLHHWVHQPFNDKYQPGMGMGWWGTHFGRHQTWIKPAKAFFSYLTRCQMLLQQGRSVSTGDYMAHRSTSDAEIFFITNPSSHPISKTFTFPVNGRKPEFWDAVEGTIKDVQVWKDTEAGTFIDLNLDPNHSIFVVFPITENVSYSSIKIPDFEVIKESIFELDQSWKVSFAPKLRKPFHVVFNNLIDFSKSEDLRIKYFSGTADYQKQIYIQSNQIQNDKRILIDLGELNDIVQIKINGEDAGVIWYPPYKKDITKWLKKGNNTIIASVTNNWANRLIGDEQEPADFEWGEDRGAKLGRAMKAFPEWFIKDQPRPSSKRVGFTIWHYHRKESQLQPAGLLGPVKLIEQDVIIK